MTVQQELLRDPRLVYRMTVDEYHQMIECGALEEGAPYELLDGHVVRKVRNARGEDPMTIGTQHMTAVSLLGDLNSRLKRLGCYMRTQAPLSLPPNDEPEPDGAIVRGALKDYKTRHPSSTDVLCVFEVSDASLKRDRGYKQQLHASHGIPIYVIVNLSNRTIEVRTKPSGKRYESLSVLKGRQQIKLITPRGKDLAISMSELLP